MNVEQIPMDTKPLELVARIVEAVEWFGADDPLREAVARFLAVYSSPAMLIVPPKDRP